MITPSESAEKSRSAVTAPPILIPGIQCGRGITGSEKIFVPGTGTPIVTPMKVRINNMLAESLRDQEKLLPHGASSLWEKTITPITPTEAMATMGEPRRATAIAIVKDHNHHVSGCNESFFM